MLYIIFKFAGGTHDAHIWRSSGIKTKLEENSDGWLLGDRNVYMR